MRCIFTLSLLLCLGITPLAHAEMTHDAMDAAAARTEPFNNDATSSNGDSSDLKDPLEPLNRGLFGIHQRVDGALIRPVAQVYEDITHRKVKDGVSNFMDNLLFPVDFVNFVLQGRFNQAGTSLFRFLANSTMGVLGIFDAGTELGLEKENTGFAETLGGWGMEEGPYLFIPIFGPSSFRGVLGMGADYFGHPLYLTTVNKKVNRHNKHHQWWHWYTGKQVLDGVRTRAKYLGTLDDLEAESIDFYVAIRSAYGQKTKSVQEKIRKDRLKYMDGSYTNTK